MTADAQQAVVFGSTRPWGPPQLRILPRPPARSHGRYRLAPRRILLGKSQDQVGGDLTVSWSTNVLPLIAVIPLHGNQLSVPAQDRIGCKKRANLLQPLATEDLAYHAKSTPLIVTEQNAFLTELLLQYLVLGAARSRKKKTSGGAS